MVESGAADHAPLFRVKLWSYLLTYLLTYLNIVMEWRIDLKKLHVTGFAPLDIVYGVRVIDNVGVIYPFPMLDSLTRLL